MYVTNAWKSKVEFGEAWGGGARCCFVGHACCPKVMLSVTHFHGPEHGSR